MAQRQDPSNSGSTHRRMPPRHAALITGSSSGIGAELTSLFARDDYPLVLVARRAQRLEETAEALRRRHGIRVSVIAKDLSLPHAPEEIFSALQRAAVSVGVLVNNAGFGAHGPFAAGDVETELAQVQVNVTALTHLTRLFLPGMLERREGKILNVASTAAFQPGPLMAVYYASKAYVLSFSEALAHEVRGSGVAVTALCPGPTRTEFQARAGVGDTPLMRGRIMDARAVAEAGYAGLMRGRPLVIPGWRNRMLATLVRWLPRSVVADAVRSVQEQRRALR